MVIVENHILIPSKYMPNKYESLKGKMFTLDPSTKKLKCTFGAPKEMQANIISQDSCYTTNSKTYMRLFIDNVFDERFYTLPYILAKMDGNNNSFRTNPPYRKYQVLAEYCFYLVVVTWITLIGLLMKLTNSKNLKR